MIAKSAFGIMVGGVIFNMLVVIVWMLPGAEEPTPATLLGFTVALFLQSLGFLILLTALIVGIIALVKKSGGMLWSLLAILGIPITIVVLVIELIIIRVVLGLFA